MNALFMIQSNVHGRYLIVFYQDLSVIRDSRRYFYSNYVAFLLLTQASFEPNWYGGGEIIDGLASWPLEGKKYQ